MPGELRHCTWLPEIDAYTERISQPAISSASSTARWIDCTVDSMSTTTPRLSPRDSCEPMPMTSIGLPGEYSPTSATTLEVPMSRPTMGSLSPLRFMTLRDRSEEHTSELQSLMRISYAVFCLKTKKRTH